MERHHRSITLLGVVLAAALVVGGCRHDNDDSDVASSSPTTIPQATAAQLAAAKLDGLPLAPKSKRVDLIAPPFSTPTRVTNPLFPITKLRSAILNGSVEGKPFKVETTLLPVTPAGQGVSSARRRGRDSIPGRVILRRLTAIRTVGEREGGTMPLYLSRFSYTPETWARLIGNPEDRRKAAQSYIESVGGKLHGFWYAFGAHDGYTLWEAPDNVSMAAVALAISGGGALSSLETTVLLTVDETMDALRKAEQVQYRAPGA